MESSDITILLDWLRILDQQTENGQRALKEVVRALRAKGFFVEKAAKGLRYIDPEKLTTNRNVRGEINDELFFAAVSDERIQAHGLLDRARLYIIWQALLNTRHLKTATMEIGVYRGGGSAFILRAKELLRHDSAWHYAVDTFSGHLDSDVTTQDVHAAGMFFDTSAEQVDALLKTISNNVTTVISTEGGIAHSLQGRYSFVHLDVDLYSPTKAYLHFLDNCIDIGGVIIVDDYMAPKCPGIFKAVTEFIEETKTRYQVWVGCTEQIILTRLEG